MAGSGDHHVKQNNLDSQTLQICSHMQNLDLKNDDMNVKAGLFEGTQQERGGE
jgi:hypothetical protein